MRASGLQKEGVPCWVLRASLFVENCGSVWVSKDSEDKVDYNHYNPLYFPLYARTQSCDTKACFHDSMQEFGNKVRACPGHSAKLLGRVELVSK